MVLEMKRVSHQCFYYCWLYYIITIDLIWVTAFPESHYKTKQQRPFVRELDASLLLFSWILILHYIKLTMVVNHFVYLPPCLCMYECIWMIRNKTKLAITLLPIVGMGLTHSTSLLAILWSWAKTIKTLICSKFLVNISTNKPFLFLCRVVVKSYLVGKLQPL